MTESFVGRRVDVEIQLYLNCASGNMLPAVKQSIIRPQAWLIKKAARLLRDLLLLISPVALMQGGDNVDDDVGYP